MTAQGEGGATQGRRGGGTGWQGTNGHPGEKECGDFMRQVSLFNGGCRDGFQTPPPTHGQACIRREGGGGEGTQNGPKSIFPFVNFHFFPPGNPGPGGRGVVHVFIHIPTVFFGQYIFIS